jgi:hypothetical protein
MFGLGDGRTDAVWNTKFSDVSMVVDEVMLSREVEPSGAHTTLLKNLAVFMKPFKGIIQ